MIQVLREKLERQPARGSTSFLSGCDLRRRDAYEAVWQFQPDVVISAQFLQYIPIQPASGQSAAQLSRLGFLQLCCSKLPADGLLVLFEDVAGETQQETCELGAAWGARVIEQYREHPELLKRVAELDADFARVVKRAMDNPQIMALVREAAAVLEARTSSRCRPTRTCSNKLDSPRPSRASGTGQLLSLRPQARLYFNRP